MDSSAFSTVLVTITLLLVMGLLSRAARKSDAALVAGRRVVAYSRTFKAFAVLFATLALVPLGAIVLTADDVAPLLFVAALLGMVGGALVVQAFRSDIAWNDTGIEWQEGFGRRYASPWNDVRGVRNALAQGWYAIDTAESGTIRAYTMMVGVPALIGELKARGFRVQ